MKKLIILFFLSNMFFINSYSQVIYTENFEGSFTWTVNDAIDGLMINTFWNDENASLAIEGTHSLWVTYSEDAGSTWDIGYADIETEIYAFKVFNFSGYNDLKLSFKWKCEGEEGWDYGQVGIIYDSNFYFFNNGGVYDDGYYHSQPYDTFQHLYLPDSIIGNPKFTGIVFYWINDDDWNGGLPFVIDQITITENSPPPPPVANFGGFPREILPGSWVNFFDSSTGMGSISYEWNFPGAVPSESYEQNPQVIVYSNPGSYDVTLIVTNNGGTDSLTRPDYVKVNACNGIAVRVEILTDDYGEETYWELTGPGGLPVYDNVLMEEYSSNLLYNHDVCVPYDTELEFTIHDYYGDGICCDYGEGFYNVKVLCQTIKHGGDFASFEKTRFTSLSKFESTEFKRLIDWGGQEEILSVIPTCDGGYALSGYTDSRGVGRKDVLLMKLNHEGDTLWSKTFGGQREDYTFSIQQTNDGGFIIVGAYQSSRDQSDIYLIKTNYKGDTLWTRIINFYEDNWSEGYQVQQTIDSGYIIYGYADDVVLCKTNKEGDLIWKEFFTGWINESWIGWGDAGMEGKMQQCDDNGFIFTYWGYDSNWYDEVKLLKTDAYGNTQWEKSYDCSIYSIQKTNDGGYYFTGYFDDFTENPSRLAKVDGNGDTVWTKSFYQYDLKLMDKCNDGGFILGGKNDDSKAFYLLKINANGIEQWNKNIKEIGEDYYINSLKQADDGGYIMAGYLIDTAIDKPADIFILKTDQNGEGCYFEPFENEEICLVTVYDSTNKNLITWQKTGKVSTSSYNIYKETDTADVYKKIGNVSYKDPAIFIDEASNPKERANRYKISVLDSCDKESELSPHHKTMHLTANKGIAGEVNLIWSHYEGFQFGSYKIYRGTQPDSLTLIANMPSNLNSYTDVPPQSNMLFYQVVVVKEDTCYPEVVRGITSQGPYSQSLSNLKDYSNSPGNYISVFPESLVIGTESGSTGDISVYTNLLSWDATSSETWLSLQKNISKGTLTVTANSSSNQREAIITITGSGVDTQRVIVIQGTVGIGENLSLNSLRIYPNPFSNSADIYLPVNENNIKRFEVLDIHGKVLKVEENINGNKITLSGAGFTKGMYFVRLTGKYIYIEKIIIE